MYYSSAALLCSILPALAGAFAPRTGGPRSISLPGSYAPSLSSSPQLFMSDDGDDDWFAELDSQPQQSDGGGGGRWDNSNDYGSSGSFGQTSYGNRGGGGGGGGGGYGGRGGGRGGYNNGPYERDTSRDTSSATTRLPTRSETNFSRNIRSAWMIANGRGGPDAALEGVV